MTRRCLFGKQPVTDKEDGNRNGKGIQVLGQVQVGDHFPCGKWCTSPATQRGYCLRHVGVFGTGVY
ncbi:hypothetical protein J6590_077003 [Homalodisca vitripennis]|nr:hypothetical protein J6590_077003 [Homalodisca vitripennis]